MEKVQKPSNSVSQGIVTAYHHHVTRDLFVTHYFNLSEISIQLQSTVQGGRGAAHVCGEDLFKFTPQVL
jgi:hypothetical protein